MAKDEKICQVYATWHGSFIGVRADYGSEWVFHPWLTVTDAAAEEWARKELGLAEDVEVVVDIQRDALGYVNP